MLVGWSGCVGVDDLGLLALAEAELNPGLKHVNLDGRQAWHTTDHSPQTTPLCVSAMYVRAAVVGWLVLHAGCVHVTDTGLSWLSDTCPTILTLTLKGGWVRRPSTATEAPN